MRHILLTSLLLVFYIGADSASPRNFLTGKYSSEELMHALPSGYAWIEYPEYADRAAWEKLPAAMREKYIRDGEKLLGYTWPAIQATDYLEFSRSGDRQAVETPLGKRWQALQQLVMAELAEGKGRFLDDMVNGVFLFCEQTYWGAAAHFYMYREDEGPGRGVPSTVMPDADNPIIDLFVGEAAADLAWTWYFFKEQFDSISPVINRRLEKEIREKILEPFYARNDYWWLTGWKRGAVNNWTPWCCFNVLTCILLMETDPDKKAAGVYKTMGAVDLFFNSYSDDGACDEGPSYWSVAGGKAFDYLNLLAAATEDGINIFDKELVKDIGRYIYRAYISQGHFFTNFADAPLIINLRGGTVFRYADRIGDPVMKGFGAFLLNRAGFGGEPVTGAIGLAMEDIFSLQGWENTAPVEPMIGEYYFQDMQIAVARTREGANGGFYLAAKGGNNGEGHNHNDVGSCIIFYDGKPVIVDVGVGTYTRETFTANRYKIWTMQSVYHNLPLINGVQQSAGGRFGASDPHYSAGRSRVSFSCDIAGAYPEEAKVEKWVRGYTLDHNKGAVIISDDFILSDTGAETSIRFVTPLECSVRTPGMVRLSGDGMDLDLTYKVSAFTAAVETIAVEDPRMKPAWGDRLNVVVLSMNNKKSGKFSVELSRGDK